MNKVTVIVPVGINHTAHQPDIPATALDVVEIQVQLGLKQPALVTKMLEVGRDDSSQGHADVEGVLLVFGVQHVEVERGTELQRRVQIGHAFSCIGPLGGHGTVDADINCVCRADTHG